MRMRGAATDGRTDGWTWRSWVVLCYEGGRAGRILPRNGPLRSADHPRTARSPRKIGISALARASPRAALPGRRSGGRSGSSSIASVTKPASARR